MLSFEIPHSTPMEIKVIFLKLSDYIPQTLIGLF